MTASDTACDIVVPHGETAAEWQEAAQASVGMQVGRLGVDLEAHLRLSEAGDPLARGAALAAAHRVLVLASRAMVAEADRALRRTALEAALPALARAGLNHIAELVQAALAHDGDPARQAHPVERPQ